jgi:hypothetical protein
MGSERAESSEQVGALCRFLYVEGGDEERVVGIRRGEGFFNGGAVCRASVRPGGGWWRTPWAVADPFRLDSENSCCLFMGGGLPGRESSFLVVDGQSLGWRLQFKYSAMHELHVSSKILNSCLLKKEGF